MGEPQFSPRSGLVHTYGGLVLEFAGEHPVLAITCALIALTLAPLQEVLLPHLYGRIVSAISAKGGRGRPWLVPTVLTIATLAGVQAMWLLRDVLDAHVQPRLDALVRRHVLLSALSANGDGDGGGEAGRGEDGAGPDARTGAVMSGLIRAPAIVTWWTHTLMDYVVPYAITLAWVVYYLARQDAVLALSLVGVVGALAVLITFAPNKCWAPVELRETQLRAVHEMADDSVVNRVALASLDGAGKAGEAARRQTGEDSFRRAHVSAIHCVLKLKAVSIPLLSSFIAVVVWRGIALVTSGRMDVGTFVAMFMMTTGLLGTLGWIVSLLRDSVMDLGTLSAAAGSMAPAPRPAVRAEAHRPAQPPAGGTGLWQASALALRGSTLHFGDGSVSLLRGPVGSGKSTVLKLLAGLLTPEAGSAYGAGRWYGAAGEDGPEGEGAWRAAGYMPQQPTLLDRTVIENVVLGQPVTPELRAAVLGVARRLGLWRFLERLPAGLDSPAGKNGSRLSGGQRQLVWFLRIASRLTMSSGRGAYLLLDEPTSAMDADAADALMAAVRSLVADGSARGAVVVTHQPFLSGGAGGAGPPADPRAKA